MKSLLKKLMLLVMVISLTTMFLGCDFELSEVEESSYQQSIIKNEEVVKDLVTNDTLPKVERSLERENIKRRIEFINQPDRIGYLYLLSDNGQLIKEVQVLGKVSSLNSYLTPMEQIEWFRGVDLGEAYGDVAITTQAPDLDGTYGENSNGIFWFTPDGIYQEWSGLYFYSSDRMTFTTQPLLIEME